MKTMNKHESYNPSELEIRLQAGDIEELEARLEMTSSWCTSSCGTEAPVTTK